MDSVTNQTYQNLEILVIDDGSTDGSETICDQYAEADQRIKVLHQSNQGLSAARNTGLDHATGQVIAFLDPDDAFHEDAIQKALFCMNQYHADIIVFGSSTHRTIGKMEQKQRTQPVAVDVYNKTEAFQHVLDGSIHTEVWNKLYMSSIWDGLRFPNDHVFEGTYIIFDIIDKAEHIIITNEKHIMHRIREGSICNTITLSNIIDALDARSHQINFVKTHMPTFFSYKDLKKLTHYKIKGLIAAYAKGLLYLKKNARKEIRKRYTTARKDLMICNWNMKASYYIIRWIPAISIIIYIMYRFSKERIKTN